MDKAVENVKTWHHSEWTCRQVGHHRLEDHPEDRYFHVWKSEKAWELVNRPGDRKTLYHIRIIQRQIFRLACMWTSLPVGKQMLEFEDRWTKLVSLWNSSKKSELNTDENVTDGRTRTCPHWHVFRCMWTGGCSEKAKTGGCGHWTVWQVLVHIHICLQVYMDWWLSWKMLKTGICGKFDKYLSTIHIHMSSGGCRQVDGLETGGCGQFDEDLAPPGWPSRLICSSCYYCKYLTSAVQCTLRP